MQNHERVRIAIIGAGHSGLCMAIKLKQAGIQDFLILEKAATLGGTWRDNTYPGASCDAPSYLYSFSFAQKTDWSRRFAWQPELLAYSTELAIRHDLLSHCRFKTAVTAAKFSDSANAWTALVRRRHRPRSRLRHHRRRPAESSVDTGDRRDRYVRRAQNFIPRSGTTRST